MDEVIARIVEVEKECADKLKQAEADYSGKIEEHKRILEEKKSGQHALITAAENTRLTQTVEKEKKQTEAKTAAFKMVSENLLRDPHLQEAIKKDIISILLEN